MLILFSEGFNDLLIKLISLLKHKSPFLLFEGKPVYTFWLTQLTLWGLRGIVTGALILLGSLMFFINPKFHKTRAVKITFKIISIITLLFFCVFLIYYNYKLIINPYPAEFREGVNILTTDLLLKGINPYDLASQPQYTNLYGIFYNIVVYPFALLFGPSLIVHRAVSAFFILASCLVLFLVMNRKKIPLLFNLFASLIFYASLLYLTTPIARPDALGLFLLLLGIFLPFFYKYSLPSLIISIILGVLAFYTKIYFILVIPYLTCYIFLFISKKKGVIYGVLSFVILSLSAIIVNYIFKCYFVIVFSLLGNTGGSSSPINYVNSQFLEYIKYNSGILIVLFLILSLQVYKNFEKIKEKLLDSKSFLKDIISRIYFSDFDKPLINSNFSLISFCLICSILLVYFIFGKNTGAWLTYFFQLISPFLLIIFVNFIKKQKRWYILFIPFIIFNLYIATFNYLPVKKITQVNHNLKAWEEINFLISENQNIFNSPAIVPLLVEQNKNVYDAGHSLGFIWGANRKKIFKSKYPTPNQVISKNNQFKQNIVYSVNEKKFDLIILTKGKYRFISEGIIKNSYEYQKTITLEMPFTFQKWELDIWKP